MGRYDGVRGSVIYPPEKTGRIDDLQWPLPTQAKLMNRDSFLEFAAGLTRMTGKFDLPQLGDFYDTLDELEKIKGEVVDTYTDQDPFVVNWNGPGDTENPMNFSPRQMWINIILVSTIAFVA